MVVRRKRRKLRNYRSTSFALIARFIFIFREVLRRTLLFAIGGAIAPPLWAELNGYLLMASPSYK